MKTRWKSMLALALALTLFAVACGPTQEPGATSTPGAEPIKGLAPVDSIQILIQESLPVQVHVRVLGNLPDGCTTIDQTLQERQDNTITVTVTTARPGDVGCTEALVPFDKTIALDVLGLKAGTYTVTVNGVSATFTLAVDNVAPTG
jgi:inhibitor of cysteine peptidase